MEYVSDNFGETPMSSVRCSMEVLSARLFCPRSVSAAAPRPCAAARRPPRLEVPGADSPPRLPLVAACATAEAVVRVRGGVGVRGRGRVNVGLVRQQRRQQKRARYRGDN
eukprot:scaffold72048_cov56-Phaeocystis_antarctica.AAC.2